MNSDEVEELLENLMEIAIELRRIADSLETMEDYFDYSTQPSNSP